MGIVNMNRPEVLLDDVGFQTRIISQGGKIWLELWVWDHSGWVDVLRNKQPLQSQAQARSVAQRLSHVRKIVPYWWVRRPSVYIPPELREDYGLISE